jgi:hypothetical protein
MLKHGNRCVCVCARRAVRLPGTGVGAGANAGVLSHGPSCTMSRSRCWRHAATLTSQGEAYVTLSEAHTADDVILLTGQDVRHRQ